MHDKWRCIHIYIYIYIYTKRKGEREIRHMMTHVNENTCKRRERKTYLRLRLIKKYKVGGRSILLVFGMPKKKKKKRKKKKNKRKEISKHVYVVSRRKVL